MYHPGEQLGVDRRKRDRQNLNIIVEQREVNLGASSGCTVNTKSRNVFWSLQVCLRMNEWSLFKGGKLDIFRGLGCSSLGGAQGELEVK